MFPGFNPKKRTHSISKGDWDKDGVANLKDCNAMNWRKQDGGEPMRRNRPSEEELEEQYGRAVTNAIKEKNFSSKVKIGDLKW